MLQLRAKEASFIKQVSDSILQTLSDVRLSACELLEAFKHALNKEKSLEGFLWRVVLDPDVPKEFSSCFDEVVFDASHQFSSSLNHVVVDL